MTGSPFSKKPEDDLDDQRALLAMYAAMLEDRDEDGMALLGDTNPYTMLAIALRILTDLIREQDVDPAEWAAAQLERLRSGGVPGSET